MSNLIVVPSPYSVRESLDRLESLLNDKGIRIFARFDHGDAATEVGLSLPETEVLVFGDPKVGTFLMQDDIHIAIELPLRVLAWQSDEGVKLAYEELSVTAENYQIEARQEVVTKIAGFLKMIVSAVVE